MTVLIANLTTALLWLTLCAVFGIAVKRWPELWQRLLRDRSIGIVFAIAALVWAAWYGIPMLEGGLAKYRIGIKILVPVTAVLAYFHLNFLLTRAVGGLMLLASTFLMNTAFAAGIPFRPVHSIACYLMAVAGAVMLATPWHFRDALQSAVECNRYRTAACIITFLLGITFGIFAFMG
jgi:hypothetical protein